MNDNDNARTVTLTFTYREYAPADIPPAYRSLADRAREALAGSYSVYSGFAVGAAVELDNGVVIPGANQENAAYPSGLCAERTALFYAGAAYPGVPVRAMAIAARGPQGEPDDPVTPCGACRQVMAEVVTRHGDFDVLLLGRRRSILVRASALLPLAFSF